MPELQKLSDFLTQIENLLQEELSLQRQWLHTHTRIGTSDYITIDGIRFIKADSLITPHPTTKAVIKLIDLVKLEEEHHLQTFLTNAGFVISSNIFFSFDSSTQCAIFTQEIQQPTTPH